jgi:hypothetical protein
MLRNIIFAFSFLLVTAITAQSVTISGIVKDRNDEPVGSLTIDLLDAAGTVIATQGVDCDGLYSFSDLNPGTDYSLRPDKQAASALNGVSTFDLVLISKHLLGVQSFTDIYQEAAADVDESGMISVMDMLLIRAVIYFSVEMFPGGNWLFFRTGDTQANTTFPFVLSADLTDFDFVTIKKGDVNSSSNNCE